MEQALFDFIIVVLGILFALFLNRINEKRKHKKRIHSIMTIVVANMNKDLANLKWVIKDIDHKIGLFNKLQKEILMSEEELKECMHFAIDYPTFVIAKRGYNLLNDARVDFEFKGSRLISRIILHYDMFMPMLERHDNLETNQAEENHRLFFNLTFSSDYYNNTLSEEMKKYMQTNDYLNMAEYFLCGLRNDYKKHLESLRHSILYTLQEIDKSDFK
tara:strand:+ start:50 stop:700 length:651 start_codon:yes stop_codon:yes gene_type:complete